jgi:carboxypeptidase Taq
MVFATPYDALLDEYEHGMTVEALYAFFSELRAKIIPLLQRVTLGDKIIRDDFLFREVPEEIRLAAAKMMMKTLGLDMDKSALAQTVHSFMTKIFPTNWTSLSLKRVSLWVCTSRRHGSLKT